MNMAEHLSSDVGPSARVDTVIGLDQRAGKLSICDVWGGDVPTSGALVDNAFADDTFAEKAAFFVTPSCDLLPRSSKAKHRMFFAAAVTAAFYGSFPAWAGSHDLADADGNASSMGALNATVSAAMTSHESPSTDAFSSDAALSGVFQNIDTSSADDETRLLMAELSRLAMSQAASGRVAGAGLMWADAAFADASSSNANLREVGFSPSHSGVFARNASSQNASSQTMQSRFVLTQIEYSKSSDFNASSFASSSKSLQKQPRMSRATLQLVAQETVAASSVDNAPVQATTQAATHSSTAKSAAPTASAPTASKTATPKAATAKKAVAKSVVSKVVSKAASKSSMTLPPAMPVVTASSSKTMTVVSATAAPMVLRGTTSTPSRANVKAAQRLVSVSPLQSSTRSASTRSALSKNVGVGMKKVITVASLKQLPPATQALPLNYGGSRRASVIPIGADMPSSGARSGNSSTTNVGVASAGVSSLPMASTPMASMSPARPAASRMTNQLEVATGTFIVLQTSTDLDTVAIADPTIADVAVVNSRAVLVNGKTPGITSLVIVDRDKIRQYQVRVVSAPGTLPRDVVAQIGLPGVTVRQVRDALVLEGEVENVDEARRSVEIASIYSKKVINNLTVRGVPTSDAAIAARLQGLIGLPNVTVSLFGDSVLLQGTADSAAQRALAEQVAGVSGRKILNLIQSPTLSVEEVQASFSSAAAPGAATVGADGVPIGGIDASSIVVRRIGDQIVLEGNAIDQARVDQAIAIAARSGLQVINRLQILPPIPSEVRVLQSITSAIGIPGVTAYGSPKRLVLRGTVPDSNVANAAVQIARSYASEVDNMLMTPNPIQINIDVQIVEINSNVARDLGVQFGSATLTSENITDAVQAPSTPGAIIPGIPPLLGPGGILVPGTGTAATQAPSTPGAFTPRRVLRGIDNTFRQGLISAGNGYLGGGGFGILDPFRVRLQGLYSNGNARLLSNPRSTVLSGRTATFQVGGQVPIPSGSTTGGGSTSTQIVFKDFGILLEANPVGNDNGAVTMRIRTEVSQPDPTLGVIPPGGGGLIPGFSRRQTVTEVVVGKGGTISLGGLIQNNVTQSISRIPLLSQIPILGKLFQSKSFQRNQTELVIFVTPRVLPNLLPAGTLVNAGTYTSDNTRNVGTQLGNPGITTFDTGSAISGSGSGQ